MSDQRTNLTAPGDRLIGRETEFAAVEALFAEGSPAVTLVGPPGVGKTRLALELALRRRAAREAAFFVSLADAVTPTDLARELSAALQVPLLDVAPLRIGRVLSAHGLSARGPGLFVLDNLEGASADARETIGRWITCSQGVRFVLTSREPLGFDGEVLRPVAPLACDVTAGGEISPAAQLFVERARQRAPRYELGDEQQAVARLVTLLDGLPLAIELCAAYAAVLSVEQLLALIPDHLHTLRGTGHSCQHLSLDAAIESSWRTLPRPLRDGLLRLSVLRGGFDLEAATALAADADTAPELGLALDLVGRLHDKSLLTLMPTEPGRSERRYRLYEAVRSFAERQLERSGGLEEATRRHRAYFAERTREWSAAVELRSCPSAESRLTAEMRNSMLAWSSAIAAGDASEAAALACGMAFVCLRQGPLRDVEALTQGTLAMPATTRADRARLLLWRARGHRYSKDLALAAETFAEAVAQARSGKDLALAAECLCDLANLRSYRGESAQALEDLDRAMAMAETLDDDRLRWLAHLERGLLHRTSGRVDEAREDLRRAHAFASAADNDHQRLVALTQQAYLAFSLGETAEAGRLARRALEIARRRRWRRRESELDALLGMVALERSQTGVARDHLKRAVAADQSIGERWYEGIHTGYLAYVELLEGDDTAATGQAERAVDLLLEANDKVYGGVFCAVLGAAHARGDELPRARGEFERAAALLDGVAADFATHVLALHRGQLLLAEARLARSSGREHEARSHLEEARALARRGAERAATDDDVRFALSLLEAQLGPEPEALVLSVGADTQWFEQSGERVDLSRRGPMRRILATLVHEHCGDGRALSLSELVEAGWPDQRLLVASGHNRARVTISELRKLGLRDFLRTTDEGYRLVGTVRSGLAQ